MSKPTKIKLQVVRVFGDAVYTVVATVDLAALVERAGKAAAWSKGGKASGFGGAVVVTAKQANVAGRGK